MNFSNEKNMDTPTQAQALQRGFHTFPKPRNTVVSHADKKSEKNILFSEKKAIKKANGTKIKKQVR
jgi:hypothetical protein